MRVRVFFALLCVVVPSAVHAADWVYLTTSSTNADYYIDIQSIRKSSSGYPRKEITLAWFKVDYSKDRTVTRRESKLLYHFDCQGQQLALASWVDYDPAGKVITSDNSTYPSFRPAVPDSIGYSMLDQACFIPTN